MSSNITTPSRYSRFFAARATTRSTPSRRNIRQTIAAAWASLGRLAELISTWRQRSAERRHLHGLNEYMLKDLGISRADVDRETSKRYWQE
jgi:uncharacterized protein YjiS (DUF1127 family)